MHCLRLAYDVNFPFARRQNAKKKLFLFVWRREKWANKKSGNSCNHLKADCKIPHDNSRGISLRRWIGWAIIHGIMNGVCATRKCQQKHQQQQQNGPYSLPKCHLRRTNKTARPEICSAKLTKHSTYNWLITPIIIGRFENFTNDYYSSNTAADGKIMADAHT